MIEYAPHQMYVKGDNYALWGYGSNEMNQIDRNSPQSTDLEAQTSNELYHIKAVVTGRAFTAVLTHNGYLLAYGENYSYQVSDGSDSFSKIIEYPTLVDNDVVQISCNSYQLFYLKSNGDVYVRGMNRLDKKEVCIPLYYYTKDVYIKKNLKILSDVAFIEAGQTAFYYINKKQSLYGFGFNNNSQISGAVQKEIEPVPIHIASDVIKVCAGSRHMVYLTKDRQLYAIGNNSNYVISNRMENIVRRPNLLASEVRDMTTSFTGHVAFLKSDKTLYYYYDGSHYSCHLDKKINMLSSVDNDVLAVDEDRNLYIVKLNKRNSYNTLKDTDVRVLQNYTYPYQNMRYQILSRKDNQYRWYINENIELVKFDPAINPNMSSDLSQVNAFLKLNSSMLADGDFELELLEKANYDYNQKYITITNQLFSIGWDIEVPLKRVDHIVSLNIKHSTSHPELTDVNIYWDSHYYDYDFQAESWVIVDKALDERKNNLNLSNIDQVHTYSLFKDSITLKFTIQPKECNSICYIYDIQMTYDKKIDYSLARLGEDYDLVYVDGNYAQLNILKAMSPAVISY